MAKIYRVMEQNYVAVTLCIHAKMRGQRSVRSKNWVETDGQMDGRTRPIALPFPLTRS